MKGSTGAAYHCGNGGVLPGFLWDVTIWNILLKSRNSIAFEPDSCYTLYGLVGHHAGIANSGAACQYRNYGGNSQEVNVMTNTAAVSKDKLKGIFDTDNLAGTIFKVTITPISEEEADEIEFKTLKGIAGRPLDADEVRKERLGL